mmetsp:Transcript_73647/g.85551  ORF Transcript_73647/g.85551 Transcript_73647/m.85551 type:complete len:307 (-) Transcript_73647:27-947(-)
MTTKHLFLVAMCCVLLSLASCSMNSKKRDAVVLQSSDDSDLVIDASAIQTNPSEPYTLVEIIKRKTGGFFTEGLTYYDSTTLLESVGIYGGSAIHKINLITGDITQNTKLPGGYFGEGCDYIVLPNGQKEVYQMTWEERIVFVYDGATLNLKRNYTMPSQIQAGWGLTKGRKTINGVDKQIFYASDGTNNIYTVDPNGFTVLDSFQVFDDKGQKVVNINELEIVNGKLWANIWMTSRIIVIDLETKKIAATLDFSELVEYARESFNGYWNSDDCLNGIAFDDEDGTVLITGKMWGYFYKIRPTSDF